MPKPNNNQTRDNGIHLLQKHGILMDFSIRKRIDMGQFVQLYRGLAEGTPAVVNIAGPEEIPGVIRNQPVQKAGNAEVTAELVEGIINLLRSKYPHQTREWLNVLNRVAAELGFGTNDED